MFTTVASSTTMSWASERTTRASHRPGTGSAADGGAVRSGELVDVDMAILGTWGSMPSAGAPVQGPRGGGGGRPPAARGSGGLVRREQVAQDGEGIRDGGLQVARRGRAVLPGTE